MAAKGAAEPDAAAVNRSDAPTPTTLTLIGGARWRSITSPPATGRMMLLGVNAFTERFQGSITPTPTDPTSD